MPGLTGSWSGFPSDPATIQSLGFCLAPGTRAGFGSKRGRLRSSRADILCHWNTICWVLEVLLTYCQN